MNESNEKAIVGIPVGIPVKPSSLGTQVDWSPFRDCFEARNRWDLAGRVGVLAYRIVLGDIFKNRKD